MGMVGIRGHLDLALTITTSAFLQVAASTTAPVTVVEASVPMQTLH